MDTRVRQKDGDHFYISTAKPIFDKENDLVAIVCVSKEITYRKKIEDELRYIISHDTLTGLYNRHFFQTELQRLQHGRQFPVSVVMLDVDRLDTINHKYGRKTGDAILVKVGAILKVAFRMEEIIARIGDDEFAVLLPKTGERQLADIVSRLKKDIDKAQDPLLKLTLSTATAKEGDLLTEIMKQTEQ
jgi:diguanylate cyclase (GGDEF)-like protein